MWGLGVLTLSSVISMSLASSGARLRSHNYDTVTAMGPRDTGENKTRVRPRVPPLVPADTCPGVPGHNSARYPCPRYRFNADEIILTLLS